MYSYTLTLTFFLPLIFQCSLGLEGDDVAVTFGLNTPPLLALHT